VARIALIGDSFVVGYGVRSNETLGEQLRGALAAAGASRPLEVLNLGVPGDNLPEHVDEYLAVRDRLSPDVVVLCLTLPNDLSDWGRQRELASAAGPSAYSAARFLVGAELAAWSWGARYLGTAVDHRTRAILERELARLGAARGPADPPLVLFTWFEDDADVRARTSGWRATWVAPRVAMRAEMILPGDGHPSSVGAAAGAAAVSGLFAGTPDLARIVGLPARN
jgi:hypothetical protein